jgi:Flp pilus assembly protein TadG
MRTRLKRLAACQSGTAILEFAFALPVVLMLVTGTIEFAILSFSTTLLEGGLREAARYGITGLNANDGSREARIVEIVNEHAAGLLTITTDDVETLVYQDFADIGEPEPYTDSNGNGAYDSGEPYTDVNCNGQWDADRGAHGTGAGDEVVLYRVTYQHHTITGFLDPVIAPSGAIPLQASIAVRNEPFPGGPVVCPST